MIRSLVSLAVLLALPAMCFLPSASRAAGLVRTAPAACSQSVQLRSILKSTAALIARAPRLTVQQTIALGHGISLRLTDLEARSGGTADLNFAHGILAALASVQTAVANSRDSHLSAGERERDFHRGIAAARGALTRANRAAESLDRKCRATPGRAPATPTAAPVVTRSLPIHFQGSGQQTTPYFIAPAEWKIDWSYDCSNFGPEGNFMIDVLAGPNKLRDIAVNRLSASGRGTAYEHQGGRLYLSIISDCDWTVTALTSG